MVYFTYNNNFCSHTFIQYILFYMNEYYEIEIILFLSKYCIGMKKKMLKNKYKHFIMIFNTYNMKLLKTI